MFKPVFRFTCESDVVWLRFRAFYYDLPDNLRSSMPSLRVVVQTHFAMARRSSDAVHDWGAYV